MKCHFIYYPAQSGRDTSCNALSHAPHLTSFCCQDIPYTRTAVPSRQDEQRCNSGSTSSTRPPLLPHLWLSTARLHNPCPCIFTNLARSDRSDKDAPGISTAAIASLGLRPGVCVHQQAVFVLILLPHLALEAALIAVTPGAHPI